MMFTVMNVLTVPDTLPSAKRNLLVRKLRASHEVFDPIVDPEGHRVGIQVKAAGVTPFDAVGPALQALAIAMRDSSWLPRIELLELTVEPGELMTVLRRPQ